MNLFRSMAKPLAYFVLVGFLASSLSARAGMIGTQTVINAAQAKEARAHIRAALDREDVQQALLAHGAEAAQVQARVDSLTDDEAVQLSNKLDEMPAGSGALELAVFVFLVLLLTDILGFTDIFPFVKKTVHHH